MEKAGPIIERKQELRSELCGQLRQIAEPQRMEKSKRACRNLIATEQFQRASTIMIFLSLPHEVDTTEIILYAWQHGKAVAVPKISWQQRRMLPVIINTLDTGFSTKVMGLRNPVKGAPLPLDQIEMVITPGLGFDGRGNRLGRGGAYYDAFFANRQLKAARCGLAFAEQLVDNVPTTETDQPMDLLVTDKEVLYFSEQNRG